MTATATAGYSISVPDSWDTLAELMTTDHRLVITWTAEDAPERTVTNLTTEAEARPVYERLARCSDVAEVLWQTRGRTGRPRFQAVAAIIGTTLPL